MDSNQLKLMECCMCHKTTQPGIVLLNIMGEWYCGNCYLKLNEKMKNQMKELREEIKS